MPSINGDGPRRAILYARVSTDEQARSGYSLAQQIEALRDYATRERYEILEEVSDPGQSGASLERPGMDRVRDLVAAGGISVVLAQDRDRFSREPAYSYLLRREFEEHDCKLRSLNDRGDDSPEGELTDGILDQLAKYERAKIAERSRRGRLRKAREGKLLRNSRAHYGFKHDDSGEAYVVDEEEMGVVRRVFRDVVNGQTLYKVRRALELEGVPAPEGGRYWSASFLRTLIDEDVYKPLTCAEIAEMVAPGVAVRLEKSESYGLFWYNRTRTVRKRISTVSEHGREYRWKYDVKKNPKDQWVAIPVPDSGIPREVVEVAREMVKDNRSPGKTGRRFWQIPGGAVRCSECETRMLQYAAQAGGRIYAYYKCSRIVRFGRDACCPDRKRTNHRAEEIEQRVWEFVSGLMKDPKQLRKDLERMIELERQSQHGDPEQEMKLWLDKLAEVDEQRRGFLRLAAKGRVTDEELDEELAALEETRKTADRELKVIKARCRIIEELEHDKDALLEHYAALTPVALDSLTHEERCQLYKILRLKVSVHPDSALEVSGVFGDSSLFSNRETVPR